MNKTFAIGLQSVLLVGALLPFSPLMPADSSRSDPLQFDPLQSDNWVAPQSATSVLTAPDSELVAFGRGVPRFRGGGGTR